MVTYLLDFLENIRFSKTPSEYQEQPHPLFVFLDPPKKNACNIRRIFMEHSGNISIFNIPGTSFWEYSPEFHRQPFPNIPGIYDGNVPRIFHEHVFARWVFAYLV